LHAAETGVLTEQFEHGLSRPFLMFTDYPNFF
jgi:hypothetical protein